MWKFKSSKTGEPVDVYEFINDDKLGAFPLYEVRKAYEKMTYMIRRDEVILYLANYFSLEYPDNLYTMSKIEIEIWKENINSFSLEDFIKNRADKIDYIELIIDKNKGEIYKSFKNPWNYFEPKITIKGCYKTGKKQLEMIAKLIDREIETENIRIINEFNGIIKNTYEHNKKLADEIFINTDESDKKMFLNIYNKLFNLFNNHKKYSIENLKDNQKYNDFVKVYYGIKLDIDLLLKKSEFNNYKPYISINIDDGTFEWNYSESCFADYIYFLNEFNKYKQNNEMNRKTVDWKPAKLLFPQYKNIKLKDIVGRDSQDSYELLAKLEIVKILLENDKFPERFDDKVTEILKKNKKLYDLLS